MPSFKFMSHHDPGLQYFEILLYISEQCIHIITDTKSPIRRTSQINQKKKRNTEKWVVVEAYRLQHILKKVKDNISL